MRSVRPENLRRELDVRFVDEETRRDVTPAATSAAWASSASLRVEYVPTSTIGLPREAVVFAERFHAVFSVHLAERAERGPHFAAEDLRLFPGGEVPALVDLVEIDEVGIGLLDPAPRRLICLVGEYAHGHGDGDPFGIPKATLVFPIEPRRGDPRVRQPKERDVVEDVVTRQLAGGAGGPAQSLDDRRGRL